MFIICDILSILSSSSPVLLIFFSLSFWNRISTNHNFRKNFQSSLHWVYKLALEQLLKLLGIFQSSLHWGRSSLRKSSPSWWGFQSSLHWVITGPGMADIAGISFNPLYIEHFRHKHFQRSLFPPFNPLYIESMAFTQRINQTHTSFNPLYIERPTEPPFG